eukprot:gnl/TRDRNA2_/TRDRNA2_67139_c0_seq1.p1 gnl/TRDRNA2_/TRDRNA2_67139_c0~~gnl/TRDRNA2_/TRDRNA2_67139_c0_seq1.p1  ORF type:complete len:107 (-),score=3.75 gnl/TRDRNA2_/TRDRNA2_67139_c0_seq1:40-360(-)
MITTLSDSNKRLRRRRTTRGSAGANTSGIIRCKYIRLTPHNQSLESSPSGDLCACSASRVFASVEFAVKWLYIQKPARTKARASASVQCSRSPKPVKGKGKANISC